MALDEHAECKQRIAVLESNATLLEDMIDEKEKSIAELQTQLESCLTELAERRSQVSLLPGAQAHLPQTCDAAAQCELLDASFTPISSRSSKSKGMPEDGRDGTDVVVLARRRKKRDECHNCTQLLLEKQQEASQLQKTIDDFAGRLQQVMSEREELYERTSKLENSRCLYCKNP
eukprot:NODE_5827_length_634_cov_22.811966_g5430_i0.p1 GENE.NODE_5827_length_634_cov_22.811966_g5430_i0~~NODE_5827_length_634_cov_22.811966_g5430_i0.p1  ORF type:complete len:175 (+),score=42.35 NODE_5827_length_634_cov_22.811966_g5430_i0:79-603(+)